MDSLIMQIFVSAPIILIVAISILTVAIMDIQARRRAEYKNQELNAIISAMGEGLIVVDKHQRVLILNQAAGVMLRQAPQDLLNKKIEDVLYLKKNKTYKPFSTKELINKVIIERDIVTLTTKDEIFCKDKNNKYIPITLTAAPFFQKGEIRGAVSILHTRS